MIVDAGLNVVRDWLSGDSPTLWSHIALGDQVSPTAPTPSDTALESEQYRDALTKSAPQSKKVEYSMTLTTAQGNGYTYTEVGAFNDPAAGTMFNRQTFTGVAKTASIEMRIKITTTLSDQ